MPYSSNRQLPGSIKNNLPKHAQDIFRESYNSAYKQYKDPDKRRGNESHQEASRRVAWSAVKNNYKKGNDGKWHKK